MAEISSTNTVYVSLSATPIGLAEANIASIVIFSNETPSKSGSYFAINSASEVADIFGSNSRTYAMANAVLAQTPNLRTARGSLYVAPFVATNATRANFVTTNIYANVENFASVTNGSLKITVDGTEKTVTGLNFTGCATIADIAEVIDNAGLDVEVIPTAGTNSATITFASKLFGSGGSVAISSTTGGTDISGATYLNTTAGTTNVGANSSATETLADAIARISSDVSFGGVLTTLALENAVVKTTADAVQSMDKIFFYPVTSLDNISVLGNLIKQASDFKTRLLACSNGIENSFNAIAGYASIALSPNFKASNTANTMNLKSIATVAGDQYANQDYYNKAEQYGVDLYGITGGLSMVYSNDNGKYTDEVVGDLWLKTQLEVKVFNVLRQTNTKVAQTETGMTALKNACEKVCIQSVNNGLTGVGLTWNGTDKFGDPEDFDRNITEKGYYIYSQPIAQQDQADREARRAPVIQIAIKRAGAIHHSEILIFLER